MSKLPWQRRRSGRAPCDRCGHNVIAHSPTAATALPTDMPTQCHRRKVKQALTEAGRGGRIMGRRQQVHARLLEGAQGAVAPHARAAHACEGIIAACCGGQLHSRARPAPDGAGQRSRHMGVNAGLALLEAGGLALRDWSLCVQGCGAMVGIRSSRYGARLGSASPCSSLRHQFRRCHPLPPLLCPQQHSGPHPPCPRIVTVTTQGFDVPWSPPTGC